MATAFRDCRNGTAPVSKYVPVKMEPSRVAEIDAIAHRNGLTRSEVIRLLVDRGLKAAREDARARAARLSGIRPGDC